MADLIARLRLMVGDPGGASPTFTADELEAALDARRTDVREAVLRPLPRTVASLLITRDYYAPRRWWEADAVLSDTTGATLATELAEPLAGHWRFAADTLGPVYVTGVFYDLYGSAQAVLETWAGKVARDFDFGADPLTFSRSQKREGLLAVAREYGRRAVQPGQRPSSAGW